MILKSFTISLRTTPRYIEAPISIKAWSVFIMSIKSLNNSFIFLREEMLVILMSVYLYDLSVVLTKDNCITRVGTINIKK